MGSVDLEAFDIAREKPAVRERYGDSSFGLGCLLARRLVEAGVRAGSRARRTSRRSARAPPAFPARCRRPRGRRSP
ncbi:MAG: DUF1501 domain-containing protein [Planctomycetota bacterium]